MGGCGEGRKQGGAGRRGNRRGREIGLRQKDPPREKDQFEPESEREQSTNLSEELEAFEFEFRF